MITLDHHIVPSTERDTAAAWFAAILGIDGTRREGPFLALDLAGGTSLFFAGWDREVAPQHYAFAVGPDEFGRIVERLEAARVTYWADHTLDVPGTIRRDADGCGVYFSSPDGHLLELLSAT